MNKADTNEQFFSEHPGCRLKQILEERGWSQSDLAFILGQQVTGINLIVSGKRGISPEMSKALGEALGFSPDYFADLQTSYDIANANNPSPAVSLRAKMQKNYPIREMIKRGWIQDGDAEKLQLELVRFFGVSDPTEIPYMAHAAKKSRYEEVEIPPAQLAWLYRVKQIARSITVPKYSELALRQALKKMQDLLQSPEEARHVPLLLAECGVRFIIVELLPQSKIDGVCFWLDEESPVIGISTRYDRIDNFWFVLRHEIEHVLKGHGKDVAIVDTELEGNQAGTNQELPEEERVANAAASAFCVPQEKMDSFIKRKHPFYYEKDVLAFSKIHKIHPGLMVGQLQYRLGKYDYLKKYQVKIRQYVLPGAMADGWGQLVPID
jgi:HTH-type transcriptional regulator / antitoxin HigA